MSVALQYTFEQWIPNMLAVAHAGLPQNGQANKALDGTALFVLFSMSILLGSLTVKASVRHMIIQHLRVVRTMFCQCIRNGHAPAMVFNGLL